jgi:hypothetical protein
VLDLFGQNTVFADRILVLVMVDCSTKLSVCALSLEFGGRGYTSYYSRLPLIAVVTRELDAEWWSVGNLLCK